MRIDLIKCGVARLARAAGLAAWLFAAFLATSCDSTEHVLLLDIHAAQPVADVQVFLSSLGRPQPRFQNAPITIPMEERDISETPARIAIEVGGPTALIAHLVGTLATGEKVVATRCYDLSVESVIDDAVILVGPLDALDVDGDTFAADPSIACQELADDGGFRPCGDSDLYLCASDLVDDCDDTNESIFPGATPQCQDGVDDDCDDDVDEACADNDNDDWTACAPGMTENCDCNDGDSTVSPTSPEVCG
ncbi:MAG: MopE-related protein, partial [Sandaracinaceae bacterium]